MRKLLVLVLVGCASAGSASDPSFDTQRTILTDDRLYQTTVTANAKTTLAAPADQVWRTLADVYKELGVDPTLIDQPNRRLGNTNFSAMRRFAGQSLSAWLHCGDSFSGPRADNDKIFMSLVSTVRPTGTAGSSELEIAFSAAAQSMDGASSDRASCSSTGRLEARIREGLANRLGISVGQSH